MPTVDVVINAKISRSSRVRQLEGMFDVPPEATQILSWKGEVPIEEKDWNIGLIVGPSGSGKSSVVRQLWSKEAARSFRWRGKSVVDDFAKTLTMEQISKICQAVGFNTIPAWMRPYKVLSTGEKFRVDLARRLVESKTDEVVVVDEFTSVVDRQVAKIGSHAVQKYARRNGRRFVAVSCHYDVIDWLQPDWVLEPATMQFQWRSVQPRPALETEVCRVDHSAWDIFAPFHYLTAELHKAARCYVLFIGDDPAAFAGMMHRPRSYSANSTPIWGCSRLVTLPDFQGLGLAFIIIETISAALGALNMRCRTYPAHPALIHAFDRSKRWLLKKRPGTFQRFNVAPSDTTAAAAVSGLRPGGLTRPCAVFEYAGDAMDDPEIASSLWEGV